MSAEPSLRGRLLSALASYRDEIRDFTQALVAVPTENPPGKSYANCVSRLERKCSDFGLDRRVVEARDPGEENSAPAYSLLAFHGRRGRTLYFHGHYDVVPASGQSQFRPRLRGTKLFGRGAADMKGGLAAMIYAVQALKDSGVELDGRIGLVMVPDEETGGRRGSRHLAELGLLGKDGIGMLTPEPTGGAIWNACRGAISLRVTVRGKPAHVGLHYRGTNAFEKMLRVADALLELKAEVDSKKTAFRTEFDAARNSILLIGGRCEGGTSFNTVPAHASFTVDRRINPEEDLSAEKRKLLRLFDRLRRGGIDLEIETLQEGRPAGFSEDGEVAGALARSVEAVTGKAPRYEMCPGLLEIRFYAEQGVPGFAYGPGLLSVSHGPSEFVNLREVERCAAIYALTAVHLLVSQETSGPNVGYRRK